MGIIKSIKEKRNSKKPLDILYKKGKITFEEVVDIIAADFVCSAFYFYDSTMQVKRDVERYNSNEKHIKEAIENIVSDGKESNKLAWLYVSQIGNLPKEIREYVKERNALDIQSGILSYINYTGMCELAGEEMLPERLFERCFREDIVKKANELIKHKFTPEEYDYPDMGQIKHFWRIVSRCNKAMYEEHVECFNENGFVTSGTGGLLEIDYIKDLVEIDYKGLL